MVPKPIFPNEFVVKGTTKIKRRVERAFFTEIYALSNGSFLYLFLDLNPENIANKKSKFDLLFLESENTKYVGIILDQCSASFIPKLKESIQSNRGFECIAGMRELKNILISDVINPLKHPENFKKFKVSIPNGIILYGPPGCGKTFIVRKLAEELDYNFYQIKHSDLATPFIHGSVGNIGKVFEIAKQNAPAIVFFDEISGLVPNRQNLSETSSHKEEEVNEFLMQLNDAADNKILVVGATNYIDRLDPAVLRPGRFDKKIFVSPPDFEARKELFRIGLEARPHESDTDFNHLAKITDGFTCADIIEGVIESAAREAANLNQSEISQKLIEKSIGEEKFRKK